MWDCQVCSELRKLGRLYITSTLFLVWYSVLCAVGAHKYLLHEWANKGDSLVRK